MGNVVVNKENMKTLAGYCGECAKSASSMKGKLEKLRVVMTDMYNGQAYDLVQESLDKLESQCTLISESYKVLKKYANKTEFNMAANDQNEADRANQLIENSTSSSSGSSEP